VIDAFRMGDGCGCVRSTTAIAALLIARGLPGAGMGGKRLIQQILQFAIMKLRRRKLGVYIESMESY
jgi:hypothetical protein